MANSLCRRCVHWGGPRGDKTFEYCHLQEQQAWFGREEGEPRARLFRERREGPVKYLKDVPRRDGPWECKAFEELQPDWRHA